MSRSFAIRFYTKHDIDLLTLYYRNVDVANVMHQVLVAFIKGEEFLLSLPNPSEDDFQPQSTHGAKVEYRLFLDEEDATDRQIIEMIDKINPGAWNNFFKSLLRLYLWRPIAENFLNNKEDYLYFTEKLYPFTKDKCKMMLITRKKPAKRKKKMVKKHTTSIPSPETPIPPKIEKTKEEPIDLMPEAVIKQSPPESTPISPPMPESEHSVYPKKEQQEEPEKENTFYFEETLDPAANVEGERLDISGEDMDDFTSAFAQLIDS